MKNKRYFPCPICHGRGGDNEEWGFEECGYCEGEGMILIRGRLHKKWKALDIGLTLVTFAEPKKEFTTTDLIRLGKKALLLAKNFNYQE